MFCVAPEMREKSERIGRVFYNIEGAEHSFTIERPIF